MEVELEGPVVGIGPVEPLLEVVDGVAYLLVSAGEVVESVVCVREGVPLSA